MADTFTVSSVAVFAAGPYRHAQAFKRSDTGVLYFGNPERIPYEDRDDTTLYVCYGGEFLWDICVDFYKHAYPNPQDLVDAVAGFQPVPLVDWSTPFPAGKALYMPSIDFIEETVFGDSLLDVQDL